MRLFGTDAGDYFPPVAAAAVAAVYLTTAYGYSPEARAAPLLIGWGVVVLSVLDFVSRTQTPPGKSADALAQPRLDPARRRQGAHRLPIAPAACGDRLDRGISSPPSR